MTLDQFVARSMPHARVEVTYTRNRCILINCIRSRERTVLRIHRVFRKAPRPVARAVVGLYLKQPRERAIRRSLHSIINEYIDSNESRILQSWEQPIDVSRYPGPRGRRFDLGEMFHRLNESRFDGRLSVFVTWSRTAPRRSLGTWLETPARFKNIITVNRMLDRAGVPLCVVEEVLHHEMLHEAIPAVRRKGRKYMHTPVFRSLERAFPAYEPATRWVEEHWDRHYRRHHGRPEEARILPAQVPPAGRRIRL